jgi:hypothetical protein
MFKHGAVYRYVCSCVYVCLYICVCTCVCGIMFDNIKRYFIGKEVIFSEDSFQLKTPRKEFTYHIHR